MNIETQRDTYRFFAVFTVLRFVIFDECPFGTFAGVSDVLLDAGFEIFWQSLLSTVDLSSGSFCKRR